MSDLLLAALIGMGAGLLSGMFGVGGGVLTTPAIRLLLDTPALVSVGTPLPVIIPTAVAGAWSHLKLGSADLRTGLLVGAFGAVATVPGAYLSDLVGGSVVMMVTAALIAYMAFDILRETYGRGERREATFVRHKEHRLTGLVVLGLATGLYSGFLGLGGGFILVPMLVRFFGMPIKKAIGTSLIAIAVLAVPGSVVHLMLGHVDVGLALGLMVGVVPGAVIGARLTALADEKLLKTGFALLLVIAGVALFLNESGIVCL